MKMKKYLSTMNICIALVGLALIYLAIAYHMNWYPFGEEEYKPKWVTPAPPAPKPAGPVGNPQDAIKAKQAADALAQGAGKTPSGQMGSVDDKTIATQAAQNLGGKEEYYYFTF